MNIRSSHFLILFTCFFLLACGNTHEQVDQDGDRLKPVLVTEPVRHDTDDPAIWINQEDVSKSLVIGTDKNTEGALFVFDLKGKIIADKTVTDLERPNNVDVAYGLSWGGKSTDIAVTGERYKHHLRIFSVPDMKAIDGGGIPVFEGEIGEEFRDVMGIALYKKPSTGEIYAIVGRKSGPTDGSYLWQYLLTDNGDGSVGARLVRKFGNYSGKKEIEAIAVDHELGFIYCSDEAVGVRKYYADPEKGNEELALFAKEGFAHDHEGISIYNTGNGKGFLLVSDQQANEFHVYPREGTSQNPHKHPLLKEVKVSATKSDGSEITSTPLSEDFPYGIFVAMSDDRTFHYYSPKVILDSLLQAK